MSATIWITILVEIILARTHMGLSIAIVRKGTKEAATRTPVYFIAPISTNATTIRNVRSTRFAWTISVHTNAFVRPDSKFRPIVT